jgi:hypothetical protein
MTDLYLSAADDSLLPELLDTLPAFSAVYIVGYWGERTGGDDDAPVMTPVPGYHVNVRLPAGVDADVPAGWARHYPATPWCIWGDP